MEAILVNVWKVARKRKNWVRINLFERGSTSTYSRHRSPQCLLFIYARKRLRDGGNSLQVPYSVNNSKLTQQDERA